MLKIRVSLLEVGVSRLRSNKLQRSTCMCVSAVGRKLLALALFALCFECLRLAHSSRLLAQGSLTIRESQVHVPHPCSGRSWVPGACFDGACRSWSNGVCSADWAVRHGPPPMPMSLGQLACSAECALLLPTAGWCPTGDRRVPLSPVCPLFHNGTFCPGVMPG